MLKSVHEGPYSQIVSGVTVESIGGNTYLLQAATPPAPRPEQHPRLLESSVSINDSEALRGVLAEGCAHTWDKEVDDILKQVRARRDELAELADMQAAAQSGSVAATEAVTELAVESLASTDESPQSSVAPTCVIARRGLGGRGGRGAKGAQAVTAGRGGRGGRGLSDTPLPQAAPILPR